MITSTTRRRRLAVPLLVLALAGSTAVLPGTAAAASAAPSAADPGGYDLQLKKNADRLTLTGGAARHPSEANRTRPDRGDQQQRSTTPAAEGRYIVELVEEPAATYGGGVSGLARTRPPSGERLESTSAATQAYRKHLDAQRSSVVDEIGIKADQTYSVAFNGFSAKLTEAQLSALKQDKRVRRVTESQLVTTNEVRPGAAAVAGVGGPAMAPTGATAATSTTTTAGSATEQATAGKKPGPDTGAGMVIGVIDTGIWPASPSFAKTMPAPAGWRGTCQTGPGFEAAHCNGKIVGARYLANTYLGARGQLPQGESLSPLDMLGHGTHTASTAAGLRVPDVTIDGRNFGTVSGVAPDAQIAVYKALWGGAGYDGDIIAAIDAAVADGVDVINYSIGKEFGDRETNTAIGTAFLRAVQAGVFVSASAGNVGMSGMISNAQPWVTTVGAAVIKANEGTLRLGDGTQLVGGSLDLLPPRQQLPLVYGEQAGSVSAGSAYCYPGSIDPAKVKDRLVACALLTPYESVAELKAKGAAGMVLFATENTELVNSVYDFPVLYLNTEAQSGKLFTYLMNHPTDGTGVLRAGGNGGSVAGEPSVADFSSRGPDQMHYGVLKPDLIAPGVDVIAAVAPSGNGGRNYDAYSGTSMASPYVAGTAAILRAQHPDWSPGMVGSALRTTATDTEGTTSPLDQGSGLANLEQATDPGLTIEPDAADLVSFSTATEPDGRDLNLPSISLREYDGTKTITLTRKLTNVGAERETYRAVVSGLKGMEVTVTPKSVVVRPGETATVTITLARGSAPWDRFTTGAITWKSNAHSVRVPVAARPWGITARSYGDDGLEFGRLTNGKFGLMQPGFTGPVTGRSTGYTPIIWKSFAMPAGLQGGLFDPQGFGVGAHTFTVPADSAGLVVQTGSDDPQADLDLYLYKDDKLVYKSTNLHSSEQAEVFLPARGKYTAYVFAYKSGKPIVNYRIGHAVISRTGSYQSATLTLPATAQRGSTSLFRLSPDARLEGAGEYWAYTELTTGGQVVPGQLVYTSQSSWNQ
ncbi:S8 family serine peptidase [Micromonospora chokoriensis]|uniref:S8 family serine peptidase n=1 Tax=Micromonospora chokoriensis TaxID=356851 RepID=UPI0004C2DD18|nr:S8 family serine peptidase [Micromonospora chokoriensis]